MPGTQSARESSIEAPAGHAADGAVANGHAAPTLRRDIVVLLREVGPCSPDQLATHLGASRTGVAPAAPRARGRPARDASDRAPRRRTTAPPVRRHAGRPGPLPVELRRARREPADGDRGDRRDRSHRRGLRGPPAPGDRTDAAPPCRATRRPTRHSATASASSATIQDELGYLARSQVDADGTIRLVEHNCAIFEVAREQERACQAELELFGEVLGADLVREHHIAAGDRCCTYRVVDRTS